ncbi:MAG: glycosyltransferase family 2 protein [Clostridiales bacterium]|nr:glycosyltransferase family 2 protein [Clostridiales bacterium]
MSATTAKVFIILVNYKKYNDTIECIRSLKKIRYNNFEIIVIDNCSGNGSVDEIKANYPDIKLFSTSKNLGFAGANNLGIKYALEHNADYILLLNNDTVVDEMFLYYMVESFNKYPDAGIVGNKILYYESKDLLWFAGGRINWLKFRVDHYGNKERDKEIFNHEKEMDFISGCCMLIKAEVFNKIGLIDENYFMYYEDVDLCIRAADAGYKLIYNPKSFIYHKVGLSSGGEDSPFVIKWNTRNKLIFMHKYKYKVSKMSYCISIICLNLSDIKKCLPYILRNNKDKFKALLSGKKLGRDYIKRNMIKRRNEK